MIRTLESQKAELKAKMSKIIDEHFEEFSRRSEDPDFTINEIEELMLKQQKNVRESLTESNGRLTSSMETEIKKNALSAKTP